MSHPPLRSMGTSSWNILNEWTWKSVGHKVLFLLYTCTQQNKCEGRSQVRINIWFSPILTSPCSYDDYDWRHNSHHKTLCTSFCHKSSEKMQRVDWRTLLQKRKGKFSEKVWSIFILFVSLFYRQNLPSGSHTVPKFHYLFKKFWKSFRKNCWLIK